jgi:hypothetical protein
MNGRLRDGVDAEHQLGVSDTRQVCGDPRRRPAPPRRRPPGYVDFGAVNAAALRQLPTLLARWLPGGQRCGQEYVALNPRRSDRALGSFRVNLITGRWADFALDNVRGGDVVSLAAYLAGTSQVEAARRLSSMLALRGRS